MAEIVFNTSYDKNSQFFLTPKDIKDSYLFGVTIKDSSGTSISDEVFKRYIESAQVEIENYLDIKLKKQLISENKHFAVEDWKRWGYIKCSYPVVCPVSLDGYLNSIKQISYPSDWLMAKQSNVGFYHRNLYMVPSGSNTGHAEAVVFTGLIPQLNLLANAHIPHYWTINYITGFDVVPEQILNAMGMLCSLNLFHIAGDLILGAGIASFSLGIDGLSQSISSTSSATNAGYGARVLGYVNELKRTLPKLRDVYKGMSFGVA